MLEVVERYDLTTLDKGHAPKETTDEVLIVETNTLVFAEVGLTACCVNVCGGIVFYRGCPSVYDGRGCV